jgi:hypothetical protein
MKNLQLVLSIPLILVGGCSAFYCGVGSLFILGDDDPKYHPMGYVFVGIALCGVALFVLGLVMAVRSSTRGRPTGP